MWRFIVIIASLLVTSTSGYHSAVHPPSSTRSTDEGTQHFVEQLRRAHDPRRGYKYEVQFSPSHSNILVEPNSKSSSQKDPIVVSNGVKTSSLANFVSDSESVTNPPNNKNLFSVLALKPSFQNNMYQNQPAAQFDMKTLQESSNKRNQNSLSSHNVLSEDLPVSHFIPDSASYLQRLESKRKESSESNKAFHSAENVLPISSPNKDSSVGFRTEHQNLLKPQLQEDLLQELSPDFTRRTETSLHQQQMYLPPTKPTNSQPFDSTPDENVGYSYEVPNNRLTLPVDQLHHQSDPNDHLHTTTSNHSDSVEIFPNKNPLDSLWVNDPSSSYTDAPSKAESGGSPDLAGSTFYLPPENRKESTFNFGHQYQYNKPADQTNASNRSNNPKSAPNSLSLPYFNPALPNGDNIDDSVEVLPQNKPFKEFEKRNGNQEYKPMLIPKEQVENLQPAGHSLSVQFAGSVFNEEGLPHLNSEMIIPVDYSFSYDLRGWPHLGHEEKRSGTLTKGRYWVGLPGGVVQMVEYLAGPEGFMPKITYSAREDSNTI